MRLLVAILLVFALAGPVSAAKIVASCSVSPNPVGVNQTATITATAPVGFDFYLTDPAGRFYSWPQGPAGTVTYDFAPWIVGAWTVTVRNLHYPHPQRIGGCSFTVMP